jgi:nucleoside-diphosphate-sugar epimerase
MRMVVVGGAGQLGSALVARLVSNPQWSTLVIDKHAPAAAGEIRHVMLDAHDSHGLAAHLRSEDVVVHLAALHGFHLDAGTTDDECWRANFELTASVTQACIARPVHRLVFASSTSVYGSGSNMGPAQILDEMTAVAPEDEYDRAKVAAEAVVTAGGTRLRGGAVCLRLGRFRFDDEEAHELRKLSTGLDLADAVTAVSAAIGAQRIVRPVYVVASDVRMPPRSRRALGHDLEGTVHRFMPNLSCLSRLGHVRLPERIRKSVSSERLRQDLGWRPTQTVEAWARQRLAQLASDPDSHGCPEGRTT